jgi:hypothetical protein
LYTRLPRLLQDLAIAKGDGRYPKLMKELAKVNLLILDDWGQAPSKAISSETSWRSWKTETACTPPWSPVSCLWISGLTTWVILPWQMPFWTA